MTMLQERQKRAAEVKFNKLTNFLVAALFTEPQDAGPLAPLPLLQHADTLCPAI